MVNTWGDSRSVLWLLVLVAYGLTNILAHETVNAIVVRLVQILGLPGFLWSMRGAALVGVAGVLWIRRTRLKSLLLLAPLGLLLDYSLVIYPSERIHYFQYGLLTWIAFKTVRDRLPAALIAFTFGFADEAHQYWILYATDPVVYFDWNDVVLNLMGAIAALVLFLPAHGPGRRLRLSTMLAASAIWSVAAVVSIDVFEPDRYLLGNQNRDSFWLTSGVGTTYHVLNALEGSILAGTMLIVLCGHYWPGSSPSYRGRRSPC